MPDPIHDKVKSEESFYDTSWPYYGHSNGCLWEKPFLFTDFDKIPEDWQFHEGMVASSEVFLTRKGAGTASYETNWIVTKTGIEKVTPSADDLVVTPQRSRRARV